MRRSLIALATLTLLAGAGTGAAQAGGFEPVQYYAPYGAPSWQQDPAHWERRMAWREMRRNEEEQRIQEAARREAWRIQQEREARRAWRHAQREQHGYGYGGGSYRSW